MRILIATVTAGAGHLQAAAALEEAWRSRAPSDSIQRLDVLDFTSSLYRKVYIDSYVRLVEAAPELWAHIFKATDNPELVRKVTRFRRALLRMTAQKFIRHLKRFKPDAVLCTHYMPLEIMDHLYEAAGRPLHALTVSVVTDFEAHALWMEPVVGLYCVAAPETAVRLLARGVPEHATAVTGIPIAAAFAKPLKPGPIRRRMGLRDDLPVLLVLGGGFGMGPLGAILDRLNAMQTLAQVIVVCGRNDELRRELALTDFRCPTRVLGFVSNMHELMTVSQLVLTKPGGLTSSEALALGKPLLIIDPIPGQEAANSDFLLEHGAAVKINRVEDLPYRLDELLSSNRLAELSAAAHRLGKPDAATAICREVNKRLDGRR